MTDDALSSHDSPSPRRTWRWPIGWFGLLALAVLVYEVTRSPALGAVFVCLKFGWEDGRTARWFWKNDPFATRRRSLFWLYLAWGLCKTAAVAFLLSWAFAIITPPNQLPQPPPQALLAWTSTFLTTLVAFALSALMTILAIGYALRGGCRLWLDSAVHRARRQDVWPPTSFCQGRPNRFVPLLTTALLFIIFVLLLIVSILAAWTRHQGFAICVPVLMIAAPVALLVARDLLVRKLLAESPSECWPEEWDVRTA
jgi:hypothetical protein